jgi:hypothetical protein
MDNITTRTHPKQLTLVAETIRLPRPELAAFTDQGLTISPDATEADLIALGSRLFAVRSWTKWGLGSVFAAMLTKRPHPDASGHPGEYDTGWVSDFADAHHLDPKERRELIGVALFYGGVSPTPGLSFEHHREAMWGAANLGAGGAYPAPDSSPARKGHTLSALGAALLSVPTESLPPPPASHRGHNSTQPSSFSSNGGTAAFIDDTSTETGGASLAQPSGEHATAQQAHATLSPIANSQRATPAPFCASAPPSAPASPNIPAQRLSALTYLQTAASSGMSVTQLRAHIRGSQRTERTEQRELSIAAYGAVFDFHRFATRELATVADCKPERARMILADLGQSSLDYIAALQRIAAI